MLKNKPLAFVDVETTGLDSAYHEIIEICIITSKYQYCKKIKPLYPARFDEKAIAINGYKSSEWIHAMEPNVAAAEIAEILRGHIIVGHNPRFDMEFITELCFQHQVSLRLDPRCIDTTTIAYLYLVPMGINSLSMDSIRKFLGWKIHTYHDAYQDVIDMKRLFETLSSPWGRFKIWIFRWIKKWK